MNSEGKWLLSTVPEIGHGNPWTAWIVFLQLLQAGNFEKAKFRTAKLTSLPPKFYHRAMTRSPELSEAYAKDGRLREGNLSKIIGRLMFQEMMLGQKEFLKHRPTWVLTQEFPLYQFLNRGEKLAQMFEQVYLLIPDAFPKDSALELMINLSPFVIPVTWRQDTARSLREQYGLEPLLVAPFLTPKLTPESLQQHTKASHRYGVVKASGSGAPKGLTAALVEAIQKILPGRPIYEYDGPNSKYHLSRSVWPIPNPKLSDIYEHQLPYARVIGSYPSEVAMIAIAIAAAGGKIDLITPPPRGSHERVNESTLSAIGINTPITINDGQIGSSKTGFTDYQTRTQLAREAIGQLPIAEAIK